MSLTFGSHNVSASGTPVGDSPEIDASLPSQTIPTNTQC
jgi:hypothetical protein